MKNCSDLINNVFGRRVPRRRHFAALRLRNKSSDARVPEQLEKRLVFAAEGLITGVEAFQPDFVAGEENWAAVTSNGNGDMYARHSTTIDGDLFIADNGGFLGEEALVGFNEDGRTNLIVAEGARETVFNQGEVGGPYYENEDTLQFVIPYTIIDTESRIAGVLTLADGSVVEFDNNGGQSGTTFSARRETLEGTLQGTLIVSDAGRLLLLKDTNQVGVSPMLGGLSGFDGDNVLSLTFDRSENRLSDGTPITDTITHVSKSASNGGVDVRYQAIDMTPTSNGQLPIYAPGTLQGTVQVEYAGKSYAEIEFIANQTSLNSNGRVPLSFGTSIGAFDGQDGRLGDPILIATNDYPNDRSIRSPMVYLTAAPYFNNIARSGTGFIDTLFANDDIRRPTNTNSGTYVDRSAIRVTGEFDPLTGQVIFNYNLVVSNSDVVNLNSLGNLVSLEHVPVTARVNASAVVYKSTGSNRPVSFTMWPGLNHEADLTVALPTPGSTVNIESPVIANGVRGDGLVTLSATNVNINAPLSAKTHFQVPSVGKSLVGIGAEIVEINAAISAPQHTIHVSHNEDTVPERSRVTVSRDGEIGLKDDVLRPNDVETSQVTIPTAGTANENKLSNLGGVVLSIGMEVSGNSIPDGTTITKLDGTGATRTATLSNPVEEGTVEAQNVLVTFKEITLNPSNRIYVKATDGDIFLEGTAAAVEHNYHLVSEKGSEDNAPFMLTTTSQLTKYGTGEIRGDIATVTLGNDTFGEDFRSIASSVVDLRTDVDRIRVQAGNRGPYEPGGINLPDPLERPLQYSISIRERDDLILDAVAAATGSLSFETGGSFDLLAAVQTRGDIFIDTVEGFSVQAPLETSFGSIVVTSSEVAVTSPVRILAGAENEEQQDIQITATEKGILVDNAIYGLNRVQLNAVEGVSGSGRVFADVVEIISQGDVSTRTAANIVYVRTPGQTVVRELDSAIFEIRDSAAVRLRVDGRDTPIDGDNNTLGDDELNGSELVSPTLYADIYGASALSVSAPEGSIDVLHHSPGTLTLEESALIGPASAAGSVVIRSTLADDVIVNDVPMTLSSAVPVRFATDSPLDIAQGDFVPGDPGVYETRLKVTASYNRSTKTIEGFGGIEHDTIRRSDRLLIKDGAIFDDFPDITDSVVNGVYVVANYAYRTLPEDTKGTIDLYLVRSITNDETPEVTGRRYYRVQDGDLRSEVYISNGFENQSPEKPNPTPIMVTQEPIRAGYIKAKTVAARPLTDFLVTYSTNNEGTITSNEDQSIQSDSIKSLFDGVTLREGDEVVLREGVLGIESSPGLYTVVAVGSAGNGINGTGSRWKLERYQGIDEDGDGSIDNHIEGLAVITGGSQRTTLTGQMYRVAYDSVDKAGLSFKKLKNYRDSQEFTVTDTPFNSGSDYRLDIGTNNPSGNVAFVVTTEGATNVAGGSFGKMIDALQDNSAFVTRLGAKQEASFEISAGVRNIDLEQGLPLITQPITIDGENRLSIYGGNIKTTRDGAVVRTGSLLADIGPIRDSQVNVARKLVRGQANSQSSLTEVHGIQVGPGSDNIVIKNITIGGFETGAGIYVEGTDQVLIQDVNIGLTSNLINIAPNKYGVLVRPGTPQPNAPQGEEPKRGTGTTILGGAIVGSTEAGVKLDANTDKVRIVGVEVGRVGLGNRRGIHVDSVSGRHSIGVASIVPNVPIARSALQPEFVFSATGELVDNQVLFPKSNVSGALLPGVQLYDRETDRLWVVETKTEEDTNFRITFTGTSPLTLSDTVGDSTGQAFGFEAGFFVNAIGRSDTLVLPAGVPAQDLYLGQVVRVTDGGTDFLANDNIDDVFIKTITENDDGTTTIQLTTNKFGQNGAPTDPVINTGFAPVFFDAESDAGDLRNDIGFNEDGVILTTGSSRIVRTDVHDSIYDGILIEGVGDNTAATATSASHEIGGVFGESFHPSNNAIYSNTLSGIRIADKFFEGVEHQDYNGDDLPDDGNLPNGAGDSDPTVFKDDAKAKVDMIRIQGNYFSTNLDQDSGLTNGFREVLNIVFGDGGASLLNISDQNKITEIFQEFTEPVDTTGTTDQGPTYAPVTDPLIADDVFAVIGDRDGEGNFHFDGVVAELDPALPSATVSNGGGGQGRDPDYGGRVPIIR